jgi:hypothetical protein
MIVYALRCFFMKSLTKVTFSASRKASTSSIKSRGGLFNYIMEKTKARAATVFSPPESWVTS